jgi:antitoxin VapB
MPLSIKDPEADELARELAHQTGESITETVKQALRERLARVRRRKSRSGVSDRLLAIGRRCAARMPGPANSLDHADIFYDERGLPK